ncbi:hypothetical protein BCV69DRAFT_301483 [Microstroma glucosiphilum]|uniref:Zn(2)-C6 fungal-type domain-containing protein n=1 Tax=Pseudomicrostroma glucosiphilum TaxID=1684307 RepID=A0A316TYQ7_9BASI|nr:hypothetical protein BCV69DRAFT_301483 [Pseudomicrostroma glucosiphilum]PWN18352.1 hypothetical protein BCV69DRAFT_301483 [Pseudomicrostroma glucosiphilum]
MDGTHDTHRAFALDFAEDALALDEHFEAEFSRLFAQGTMSSDAYSAQPSMVGDCQDHLPLLEDKRSEDHPMRTQRNAAAALQGVAQASESLAPAPASSNRPLQSTAKAGSCVACSLRKVKCDRKDKLQQGLQGQALDISGDIACSSCISHSIPCVVKDRDKHKGKPRLGARLKQLKSQAAVTSPYQEQPRLYLPQLNSKAVRETSARIRTIDGPSNMSLGYAYSILGVPGLTRPILDASLHAFFKWVAPTAPIDGVRFTKGYQAFWDIAEGKQPRDRPVSIELVLALAATGVAQIESEDGVYIGALDKFELQHRLLLRFVKQTTAQNWNRRDDLDAIEVLVAVYLTNLLDLQDAGEGIPQAGTSDTKRPMSDEAIASLVMKLGLNRAPKLEVRAPANGARWRTGRGAELLTDSEAWYRRRVFFGIFLQDGFKSMGMRKPTFFPNDCHDHEVILPRRPSRDGEFSSDGLHARMQWPSDKEHSYIEAALAQHNSRFFFSVREHAPLFVSVRSQGLGVPCNGALRALYGWQKWYAGIPDILNIDRLIPEDWAKGKAVRPVDYQLFTTLRVVFLNLLFHSQILAAATAVTDFGLREDEVGTDLTAAHMIFEEAAFRSLSTVASLSRRAGEVGLLRGCPVVTRNASASYALWACDKVLNTLSTESEASMQSGPIKGMTNEEVLFCTEEIAFGVSTVDSAQDTPQIHAFIVEKIAAVRSQVLSIGGVATAASHSPFSVEGCSEHDDVARFLQLSTSDSDDSNRTLVGAGQQDFAAEATSQYPVWSTGAPGSNLAPEQGAPSPHQRFMKHRFETISTQSPAPSLHAKGKEGNKSAAVNAVACAASDASMAVSLEEFIESMNSS